VVPSTLSSKGQVEPQLRVALDAVPPFGVSAETLADFRPAVDAMALSAPDAPGVTTVERQVPRPDGTSIPVRVHTPAGDTARGALIFLHGGGMIMGSSVGYDAQSRHFAHIAGCVVVAVDYRLAPENPYPAGLEDCYTVLTWLHTAAAELGFPAGRIAVAGESGGGGLAAGLALLAHDRAEVSLSAQFLQYPMLDDRTGTDAEPDPLPYAGEFVWTAPSNRFAWQSVLGEAHAGPDVPVYAAPARATKAAGVAPAYIVVGQLDLFVGEALRYVRTLIRSGVPTELHLVPGAYHAFMSFAPEAETSRRASARFLDAIVRHFRDSEVPAP
jgi:acetyl esterase/lipase